MKKEVLKTIRKQGLIREGMDLILGLSGGPDSVCLFHILDSIKEEQSLTIHPVHINHKFRPGAAEEDQAYVEELTASKGIHCRTFVYDCNKIAKEMGITSEEAGRKVRYDSFTKVAEELVCSGVPKENIAIAVAQNADDQAETILFRILRGTSIDGLSGIAYQRWDMAGFPVIRPLLDVRRSQIEAYCQKEGLHPRIDKTNLEPIYTRNKIRLSLLPLLEREFNPNLIATLNRLGASARVDKEYMRQQAKEVYLKIREEKAYENGEKELSILISPLERTHPALIFRIYTMALSEIGMMENITYDQLKEIDQLRHSSNPSAKIALADGYRVARSYEKLVFFKEKVRRFSSHEKGGKSHWCLRQLSEKEKKSYLKDAERMGRVFGAFSLPDGFSIDQLQVRKRRDGDFIAIKGGTKKIQDLFVDLKVPRMYRDEMDLLALGKEIVWVLPSDFFTNSQNQKKGRFSAKFKADFATKHSIIVLERQ